MTGDTQTRVALASLPFCLLLLGLIGFITVWPQIVLGPLALIRR